MTSHVGSSQPFTRKTLVASEVSISISNMIARINYFGQFTTLCPIKSNLSSDDAYNRLLSIAFFLCGTDLQQH